MEKTEKIDWQSVVVVALLLAAGIALVALGESTLGSVAVGGAVGYASPRANRGRTTS